MFATVVSYYQVLATPDGYVVVVLPDEVYILKDNGDSVQAGPSLTNQQNDIGSY